MPRVKLFDRDGALSKAMNLFWQKGYASTSLTDLTTHLGISKGSFYDTFGSKRNLFEEALEKYKASNVTMMHSIINSEEEPQKAIRKLLEYSLESHLNDPERKGCFVANTCSELAGSDDMINELLAVHHAVMHEALTKKLMHNNFKSKDEAGTIANVYITFMTGMSQEIKFKRDKAELQRSIETMLSIL